MTPTRLFDFPYYQLDKYNLEKMDFIKMINYFKILMLVIWNKLFE